MPNSTEVSRTRTAVFAIVASVAALSLGDAVIKATGLSLPLWQMYILRSTLVLPVLFYLATWNGPIRFASPIWVIVRSGFLVAMWLSYYSALPHMPLSTAAAAYYTSPILITLIVSLLAQRWPTPRLLSAIALGFVGVLIILRPDTSELHAATSLPVLAAFLYACAMVLTARKCRTDNPFSLALALNIAFIMAGVALGIFSEREGSFLLGPWQSVDAQLLLVVALLSGLILIGSVGAAVAYQFGPPGTIAAFDYSYLAFSLLWGSLFFGELPDVVRLTGLVLIVLAGLLSIPRSER